MTISINVPIICLSLKYINNNYKNMSNICKWIHYELIKYNYNDVKLLKSLKKEDYEIIKSIIKFSQDKSIFNSYLIDFCEIDKFELVKLLIDNGANIHAEDDVLLNLINAGGHFDLIKLLIDSGVNIHSFNNLALRMASENAQLNIVKLLVENGADIHAKGDETLCWSCINGYFDITKFLIDNGANIHVNNDEPLMLAQKYGHHAIVKLLIDNGAIYRSSSDKSTFIDWNYRFYLLRSYTFQSSKSICVDQKIKE